MPFSHALFNPFCNSVQLENCSIFCAKCLFSLPPDQRKAAQGRAFTRWMNAFLQRVRLKSTQFYCNTLLIYFSSEMESPLRPTICHLQRDPPIEVHDLFTDIQDGRILMALLEELSGCKLVRVTLYNRKI